MEHNKNNFDDLFRDASAGYAETPPPAVWEALKKRLDHKKKRRVFPFRWFWYFSIVSFLTLLGASIAWNTTRNMGTTGTVALNTHISEPVVSNTHVPATPSITPKTNQHNTKATKNKTATIAQASHNTKANNTATNIARKTSKNKAKKSNNTSTSNNNNGVATANESNNAQTVGTSAYSYDDFDETKPSEPLADAPPLVSASPLGTGYVTKKTKKHHIVAVEMTPATQPNSPTQPKETEMADNSVPTAPTSGQHESVALTATATSQPSKLHEEQTKATPSRKQMGAKKLRATSMTNMAVASAIKSTGMVPVAAKATKTSEPADAAIKNNATKTGKKVTAQTAIATVKNKTNKEVKQSAKVKTNNTALASNTTGTRSVKLPTGEPKAFNTSVSTKQPTTETIPAAKTNDNSVPTTMAVAAQKTPVHTATKATSNFSKTKKTSDIATVTTSATGKKAVPIAAAKVAAKTKDDVVPVTVATRKSHGSKIAKKADKQHNTASANQYAAAKNNTPVTQQVMAADQVTRIATANAAKTSHSGTNKTASKQKEKSSSLKTTTSTMMPAATPKAKTATKPAANMAVANNQNKPTGTKIATTNEAEETEKENTNMPLASGPTTAKAEGKKPEEKTAASENKKTDEPIVEKVLTTDSAKGEEPEALRRFMAGIKGGYEGGMKNTTANKFIIAPYLQYNIGGKFSLMLQPAFKASHLNKRAIGNASSSYYEVNPGSGQYSLHDSSLTVLPPPFANNDSLWRRNYVYTETHDSISKSYSVKGTYFEVELPLMVQYSITPKLSVYGGVNTVYSKLIRIKEDTYTATGLTATGNPYTLANIHAPAPTPTNTGITYSGSPISSYSGPAYPEQKGSSLRMGYMLGFSYKIKKRWMADILVQQTFIKPNYQAGYNVNRALSLPYVRFTIGYRLTK